MKKSDKKSDNFQVKEQVPEGAGVPESPTVTVMDKLDELGISKDQLYPEGNPDVDEESDPVRKGHLKIVKIPVIVFTDGSKKSRIMIKELEAKDHLQIITTIKGTNKIVQVLKDEKDKGNIYNIAYLPYSNDDCNKDQSQLLKDLDRINAKVRNELELETSVYAYFANREDAEINSQKDPAG